MLLVTNENMGLCLNMNDGTSLKRVKQIRQTDNLQSIIWVTLKHS